MSGRRQKIDVILGREVRRQQRYRREVDGSIAQQLQDDRVLSRSPGGLNPPVGGMLRQMQHLQAVSEQGGTALGQIQASLVEHGEVCD